MRARAVVPRTALRVQEAIILNLQVGSPSANESFADQASRRSEKTLAHGFRVEPRGLSHATYL
jgi:hypothetical protein